MNSTKENNKKMYEDVIRNEFPKLIQMFESYLDFQRWGFELTYSGVLPQYLPYIIYQSKQCKIRFRWEQDRPYESPKIYVNYARIHAPIDQYIMIRDGEKCYCWHQVETIINFLDRLLPVATNDTESLVPRVVNDFYQLNKDKGLKQPEYIVKKHAYIWEHYGQRIFDVLDLRRPDLWNEYMNFLKDYYINQDEQNKLKGIPPSPVNPPLYKVC